MQVIENWANFDFNNHVFFNSHNQVKTITIPIIKHFGLNFFQYYKVLKDGSDILLTTCPKWARHVYENNLYKHSFFLTKPSGYFKHEIFIARNLSCIDNQADMMDRIKRLFGITPIITITNPVIDGCEFFSFGTSTHEEATTLNTCIANLDLLEKFIVHFKEKATDLIDKALENRIIIKDKIIMEQHNQTKLVKQINHDEFILDMLNLEVTPRELDHIKLLAKGNSVKMIANQLNLSPRTVEDYVNNLRYKTNSASKQQLSNYLNKWF